MSHRPAELRSIELHRAVARHIASDPGVVARARARVSLGQRVEELDVDDAHRAHVRELLQIAERDE